MNTSTAIQLCLLLHFTGLVLFGGLSVAYMLTYKKFCTQFTEDKAKGIILFNVINTYQKFRILGAVLLIITGICMMVLTSGVYNKQIWMQIKIGLVVLLALIGPFLNGSSTKKLKNALFYNSQFSDTQGQIIAIKKRINLVIMIELLLFALIVFLSVFKFN